MGGSTSAARTTGLIYVDRAGNTVGAGTVRPGESEDAARNRILNSPGIREAAAGRTRQLRAVRLSADEVRAAGGARGLRDIDLDDINPTNAGRGAAGTRTIEGLVRGSRRVGVGREGQETRRQANARVGASRAAQAEQQLNAARAARRRVLRTLPEGASARTRQRRLRAAGADDATINDLRQRVQSNRARARG